VIVLFDKFTRTVLILWITIISITCLGAFFGIKVGDLGGTDNIVEELVVDASGKEVSTPVSYGDLGENITFTLAGLFAGIIFGYFWITLFGGDMFYIKKEGV
jgi:hypothetical protein